MSDSDFTVAVVRPCVKCGACDRYTCGRCKTCAKASANAKRINHPDAVKADKLAYRTANKEKISAKDSAYRAANKDKSTARRIANKDKINAALTVWRAANPGKVKAMQAAYYAANQESVKAGIAVWKKANPEACKIISQNRRARKNESGGKLSRGLTQKLFKLQRGLCPCCAQPLGDKYHLDHIVPLALGGSNTDDNAQLLRQRCNQQKHAQHPVEYMQSRGFLL